MELLFTLITKGSVENADGCSAFLLCAQCWFLQLIGGKKQWMHVQRRAKACGSEKKCKEVAKIDGLANVKGT